MNSFQACKSDPKNRISQSRSCLICSVLLALILMLLLSWTVMAQEDVPVTLHVEIDRDFITVGDPVVYTLKAEHPADITVNLSNRIFERDSIEVLGEQPGMTESITGGGVQTSKQYTLTAFSTGQHGILPRPVEYILPGGERGMLQVEVITLTVRSVITDTALLAEMDIRPLKPQAEIPRPIAEEVAKGAGLVGALLVLALLALWLLVWRRRPVALETIPIDTRSPERIAYDELDQIESLSLPEQGRSKEHYTLISDCLRQYAERLYDIPAMDRTTTEFVTALRKARADRDHIDLFGSFFSESDLVKFAKYVPGVPEANGAIAKARHIVNVTKSERPYESMVSKK